MGWIRLSWTDLAVDSPVLAAHWNAIGRNLDDAHDAFQLAHSTSDGAHNSSELCRGWARVHNTSTTPAYAHTEGIIDSGTAPVDNGTGDFTITLTTGAGSVDKIAAFVLPLNDSGGPAGCRIASVEVSSTTTLEVTLFDGATGTAYDMDFCVLIYLEPN